jgi:hypothetical protein
MTVLLSADYYNINYLNYYIIYYDEIINYLKKVVVFLVVDDKLECFSKAIF